MDIQLRTERAAEEVIAVLRSLAEDLAEEQDTVGDMVAELTVGIARAFKKAAPESAHAFDNLADDMDQAFCEAIPDSSSEDSSEDEEPPPKQRRSDDQARFLAHKLLTGYSHPEDCTREPTTSDEEDLVGLMVHEESEACTCGGDVIDVSD